MAYLLIALGAVGLVLELTASDTHARRTGLFAAAVAAGLLGVLSRWWTARTRAPYRGAR